MKNGKIVATVSGVVLVVFLIASLLLGSVNIVYAQEPYYGPQLLAPSNGCLGVPVKPVSFSWSPFKETTKYKFQLAKDGNMTQIVKEAEVTNTAYAYDGTLDYSTNYFWRVIALEPVPSDWSATFSFQAEAIPPPIPPPSAPPTPQWSTLNTPAVGNEILSPSEVNKIAVAADGITIWAVDTPAKAILRSRLNGWSWSEGPTFSLHSAMTAAGIPQDNQFVWDVVVAPDNPFVAVVTGSASSPNPTEVWISESFGLDWWCTNFSNVSGGAVIGTIDMSTIWSGRRDIAVGARDGVPGAFRIWVLQMPSPRTWQLQTTVPVANADIVALKFSPRYPADACLTVLFSTVDATYYNIALRDMNINATLVWVYAFPGIEVKARSPLSGPGVPPPPTPPPGASPEATTIVTADLELPSDFMGQDANLRRAYISTNSLGASTKSTTARDGIFRVDDATVYILMDTSNIATKSICSIAYSGTCVSGKLLAGEVLGYPCTATVQTWFTDAPTECPIPCWYPSLKPATGAAAQGTCAPNSKNGYGNAQVAWSPDGKIAYCGTSSADFRNGGVNTSPGSGCWPAALRTSVALDESAFSLTRNYGETWNQIGLIDTRIDKLIDVAPSADSSTIYLASINDADVAGGGCTGFDSVWRSSTNADIVPPLPAQPVGTVWERILCRPTSQLCAQEQTTHALLRLAPDKEDGEIVFWAAQGTRAQAWSPDYGDYWANMTPRNIIQDFVLESSMVLYNLSPTGLVQKMWFTGTAWATTLPNVDTGLGSAYSIAALAGGHVLVGGGPSSMFPVAYSNNGAQSFTPIIQPLAVSNIIVAFDAHFTSNGIIYAATHRTTPVGSVYYNTVPNYTRWTDLKPRGLGYYGIAIAKRQRTLYAANLSFVEHMRNPDRWDDLINGLPASVRLTLSPNSLKLSEQSKSRVTLYVIDDNSYNPAASSGMLWTYADIQVVIAADFYLHGSGSNLTLDNTPPTGATPKYVDSPSINRTTFKEIGTWTYAVPAGMSLKLASLSDIHAWVGLKNSDDQGTYFDIRAELLKNGTLVALGETKNIQGVTRNPDKATGVVTAIGDISNPGFDPGDVVSLRILAKVTDTGGHRSAVGLRLYYDALTRPSKFDATLNPPGEPAALSFEAAEYVNADYGFSVKYPKDYWAKPPSDALLFYAAAPAQVPVLFIDAKEAATFAEALKKSIEGAGGTGVKVVSEKESALADGTKASTAVFEGTLQGYGAKGFALGVQKGNKWILVTVGTVELLVPYDEAKFSEIAHTLQFK